MRFMEYWELALLLSTWAGIAILTARHRLDWSRARFGDHVNFSLNYLEGPASAQRLVLRTLFEDTARRVWLNAWGVRRVQLAAERTSSERPVLRIEARRDRELVERGVLNVLSERFSEAFLARALGLPVRSERFLFGLTWERYGDVHSHKLRVMVVRPADLVRLFETGGVETVQLERESHGPRLDTLRELHRLWRAGDAEAGACLGTVELGIPGPAATAS